MRLLTDKRKDVWPPTEVLVNFSLDAVRRIGGHVASPHGIEATMRRLDVAVNGDWWRDLFRTGVTDEAVEQVATGFAAGLGRDTRMNIVSVPVWRAPNHKPLYHLVFGTRSQHGLWAFGDSVARATQEWWETLEEVEAEKDPCTLFPATSTIPTLATIEAEAIPVIAENLARLLEDRSQFKAVEQTVPLFGDYYGRVRENSVRHAVKRLYAEGRTGCTGVGGKPRDLLVTRP